VTFGVGRNVGYSRSLDCQRPDGVVIPAPSLHSFYNRQRQTWLIYSNYDALPNNRSICLFFGAKSRSDIIYVFEKLVSVANEHVNCSSWMNGGDGMGTSVLNSTPVTSFQCFLITTSSPHMFAPFSTFLA
jgi:hypothetical protein